LWQSSHCTNIITTVSVIFGLNLLSYTTPPPVHFAPVSENTNADAPLPRVAEEIEIQVDPIYQDLTVNPGKRRRAEAKAKKEAEALAQAQEAPVTAPPPQIDHPHGTLLS
jgi:hypothetical protein